MDTIKVMCDVHAISPMQNDVVKKINVILPRTCDTTPGDMVFNLKVPQRLLYFAIKGFEGYAETRIWNVRKDPRPTHYSLWTLHYGICFKQYHANGSVDIISPQDIERLIVNYQARLNGRTLQLSDTSTVNLSMYNMRVIMQHKQLW